MTQKVLFQLPKIGLVSWLIKCQSHPYRRAVLVLNNILLLGGVGFIPFPRGISPKVNVIAGLEFKLVYYNITCEHLNRYATGTASTAFLYIFNPFLFNANYTFSQEMIFHLKRCVPCKLFETHIWPSNGLLETLSHVALKTAKKLILKNPLS